MDLQKAVKDDYERDWKPIFTGPTRPPGGGQPNNTMLSHAERAEDRRRAKLDYVRQQRSIKHRERIANALVIGLLLSIGACCIKVLY